MISQQQLSAIASLQHPTKVAGWGQDPQPAWPCLLLFVPLEQSGQEAEPSSQNSQEDGSGVSGNKVWQNKKKKKRKRFLFNQKIPFKSIPGFDERMKQWSFRTKKEKQTLNFCFSKDERRSSFWGIKHAQKWNHCLCCKDCVVLPWNGHSNELWNFNQKLIWISEKQ